MKKTWAPDVGAHVFHVAHCFTTEDAEGRRGAQRNCKELGKSDHE